MRLWVASPNTTSTSGAMLMCGFPRTGYTRMSAATSASGSATFRSPAAFMIASACHMFSAMGLPSELG